MNNALPKTERRPISTTPEPKGKPTHSSQHEAHARQVVRNSSKRSRTKAKAAMFDKAVADLRRWGPAARCRDNITGQSMVMSQVYLLCEEMDQNRDEVLRFFPPVSERFRKSYIPRGWEPSPVAARQAQPQENQT